MDFDLTPKFAQKIFDGEGGSYYSWSSSEFPYLGEAKVGAGALVLAPHSFALPHYSDTSKLGYVLQGTEGRVGMVLPNSTKEVVLKLKKGDLIPVPLGVVSWWYNDGDSELVVVFLGETSKSYIPGEITYFISSGAHGMLAGFSTEFRSRAFKLSQKDANKLAESQTGVMIIKLEAGTTMPQPDKNFVDKMVRNIFAAPPEIDVKKGGTFRNFTAAKFPFLEEIGLSFSHVKLEAKAMYSPTYTADGTVQVFYVTQGSGHLQIVGINGKRVLDAKVGAGQLLVVPRFFMVAKIAGSEGMEFISIVTTTRPAVAEFASKKSVWNALSPVVSQVALGVTPEFEELFRSNIENSTIVIPPAN